jgi:hypothetical protein
MTICRSLNSNSEMGITNIPSQEGKPTKAISVRKSHDRGLSWQSRQGFLGFFN